MSEYVVRQGDSIFSIAAEHGFRWQTVWAANPELQRVRRDPGILLPGDRVTIPELRRRDEAGATEQRHRFRRRGIPVRLRLTLREGGRPRAGVSFVLEIEGRTIRGTTDGEGRLDVPIQPGARTGTLVAGGREYELRFGALDPEDTASGLRSRLRHLGYDPGPGTGWDRRAREALRRFQKANGLDVTGEPDDATRDRLRSEHRS